MPARVKTGAEKDMAIKAENRGLCDDGAVLYLYYGGATEKPHRLHVIILYRATHTHIHTLSLVKCELDLWTVLMLSSWS